MLRDQSCETDKFFNGPSYHLNRKSLILCGGWPYLNPRKRKIIWWTINLAIFTAWVPELIYIIEIFDDTQKVIYCTMAFLISYLAFCASVNAVVNHNSMKQVLDSLKDNWNDLQNDEEREIFEKYANFGKIFTIGLSGTNASHFHLAIIELHNFSVCYFGNLSLYFVSPLIPSMLHYRATGNWTTPEKNFLEVEYFVDPVKYYWHIYVHGAQAGTWVVCVLTAYDSFFIVLVQHCCGMFAVLGYDKFNFEKFAIENEVRGLCRYKIQKMDKEIYDYRHDRQSVVEKIEKIVMYHLHCLKFAKKIEDFFCMQMIQQIMINTIIISVCGSQAIKLADDSLQETFRYAYLSCSTIFRLTIFNILGQSVFDQSLRKRPALQSLGCQDTLLESYYLFDANENCDVLLHDDYPNVMRCLFLMIKAQAIIIRH
uniref:Odorant receptor n=1 Tax=Trichogramma kaykai TaxID=54128 RepID=A0ABD2WKV9_9HYME